MDLFGPTRTLSLSGKRYGFVLVDDFSRFTWVFFLAHKNDALLEFTDFVEEKQNGNINKIST
ncbi:hypothetical protein, partial [Klebsiella pneumoniae]|uniref:hypothetical protein n=1 Tax=Klebsiella pneumoniae TaxID=573 RepID=UPI0024DE87D4